MITAPLVTDVLSSTLLKMKLRTLVSGATDAAGSWAIEIPEHEGFKLYLVLKGRGWFVMGKTRYFIQQGDCFIVTTGERFVAMSDLEVRNPLTLEQAFMLADNGVIRINGGGECFTVTVHFQFDGHMPGILFRGLPPAIHIPADAEGADSLRWNIERFRSEYMQRSMGHALVLNHLTPILLVQVLRIYLATTRDEQNWLASLSDPRLSKAIEAIHDNCQKSWSLEELARLSGMSRAGFALRFKKWIGVAPGEYLMHWRMQAACEFLRDEEYSIASIACEVGYESESAFSNAFNRVVGCRPGIYRAKLRSRPGAALKDSGMAEVSRI